uniref:Pentraxin (PTX) domain-containing protein n=1 Tax=Leptobrachium leishanense TaxID=445787 RepID=A0A8C5QRS9_9ANUR
MSPVDFSVLMCILVEYRALLQSSCIKTNLCPSAPSIAIGKISTQSSTVAYYGNPQNANDGSLANNYLRSQCSHTKKEANPWWIVDLKAHFRIFSVAITNRVLECCKERLYDAEVRIGDDPTQGGTTNPRCGAISTIESGETISFSCEGMVGKYVSVSIPGGREENLILCEVQVFGLPASSSDIEQKKEHELKTPNGAPNVAVHGIATQSSLYNMYGEPKNAIDGSLSSNYLHIQCAGTSEQDDPWWMVNLKETHKIFTVTVTNRGDCCSERIDGAQVRVGNSAENGGIDNPICGIIPTMGYGETIALECDGMLGQYVTVNIQGKMRSLTICEVQVFGLPIAVPGKDKGISFVWLYPFSWFEDLFDDCVNLAFRGISSQSSKYDRLGAAENAIDGSSSTNYLSGHCSHTDLDIEPWWRLDLTNVYNVTKVKLTNRGDCCNDRINGAEIRIGLSPEHGGTKNPKCAKISSMGLGKEEEYICGMVGRYVTVTIPDKAAYLTVCELKVHGKEVSENYTGTSRQATELRNILKHSNAASNVAVHGIASQSSVDGDGEARKAVDESLNNDASKDQCAKTKEEPDPWWTVDLRSDHKIFSIAVTNRGDSNEQDLDGAEIHVGNSATGWKKNPVCGTVSSIGLGETFSFNCDAMVGRFVTFVIPGENRSLSLCEVQIFGVSTDNPNGWNGDFELQKQHHGAKNVAPQGIPSQSSYFGSKLEVRAPIDGSLRSNYMAGECAHTKKEMNPWWRVDLKSKMVIQSVAITNRLECCRERINGAELRVGDSKENGGIGNPRCGVVNRMNYGETLSFDCKGMEGQYVTITLPNREYLTLCEMQVFAYPAETQGTTNTMNVVSYTGEHVVPTPGPQEPLTGQVYLSGRSFFFPGESGNSYVYLNPQIPMNLKALTLCMKLSLDVPESRETILFSYRTRYYDELNLWIESNGNIGLYMSGDGVFFIPIDQKREWNNLCLTWESKHGRTELWVNGRRKPIRIYRIKHQIREGGIAILGQDQDLLGGGFDAKQSYVGKIKDLNMWNRVLPLKALRNIYRDKEVQKGNIFDWSSLTYVTKGNVTIV